MVCLCGCIAVPRGPGKRLSRSLMLEFVMMMLKNFDWVTDYTTGGREVKYKWLPVMRPADVINVVLTTRCAGWRALVDCTGGGRVVS